MKALILFLICGSAFAQNSVMHLDLQQLNGYNISPTPTRVYQLHVVVEPPFTPSVPTSTPTGTITPVATATPTFTPNLTHTITPTPTFTFTSIPIVAGTLALSSPTATPVVISTPQAGFVTGIELISASNSGTVQDQIKILLGATVIFNPLLAPAGGQPTSLPLIFWDNGVSNISLLPSNVTTETYVIKYLLFPVNETPPGIFSMLPTSGHGY